MRKQRRVAPFSTQGEIPTRNRRVQPRLRTRVAVSAIVLTLLTLLAFIVVISIFVVRPYLREDIQSRLKDSVALGALGVDVEAVRRLVEAEPGPSPDLDAVILQLRGVRDRINGARFVYLVRMGDDGRIYFVADAEESPEDASPPGSLYSDPGPALQRLVGTLTQPAVEDDFYEDEWGVWLSGYAPLRSTDGMLRAVLAVDLRAEDVRRRELAFLQIGGVAMLVSIPLTVSVGWWLGKRLTGHLEMLLAAVERIMSGDLDYQTPLPAEEEAARLAVAFNTMTERLRSTIVGLEDRVAERTRELERQAAYLRATGEVSRVAASILDLDELLARVAVLVSERFGFYHTGIFLLDEARQWAVLRAASSAGGHRMIARGHRLAVGAQGIVGYVAQTGRARIALDVGDDKVWFQNPDLPDTRSEMALPLIAGGRVIGTLDVQSREAGAFMTEDINTLRILADQLAIAIANALQFTQRQEALANLERAYASNVRKAWSDFAGRLSHQGYRYTPRESGPLDSAILGGAEPDLAAPRVSAENALQLPITIAGVHLGTVRIKRVDDRPWNDEEITFASRATLELAQALESARLYEDTQRRAITERLLSDVTARIRGTLDVDMVLRRTVQELHRVLTVNTAEVYLGPEWLSGAPTQTRDDG